MVIVGHRGARGLAPENTLASLQAALDAGVDMVEFDVRVTPEGVPVLHHDRLPKPAPKSLATLSEALDLLKGKVAAYVEVKPNEPIEAIVDVLQAAHFPVNDLYLASKGQKTLRALHQALPDHPTIVIESWSGVRAHFRARQVGAKIICMNQRWLWSGFIRGFKRSDIKLYAYTINDPARARRFERYGLAGVVTDYPNLLH